MQANQIFTVEYSVVQKCYHVDTLDRLIANNLEAAEKKIVNGYLLIGMFGSHEAASFFIDYHRNSTGMMGAESVINAINNNEPF